MASNFDKTRAASLASPPEVGASDRDRHTGLLLADHADRGVSTSDDDVYHFFIGSRRERVRVSKRRPGVVRAAYRRGRAQHRRRWLARMPTRRPGQLSMGEMRPARPCRRDGKNACIDGRQARGIDADGAHRMSSATLLANRESGRFHRHNRLAEDHASCFASIGAEAMPWCASSSKSIRRANGFTIFMPSDNHPFSDRNRCHSDMAPASHWR